MKSLLFYFTTFLLLTCASALDQKPKAAPIDHVPEKEDAPEPAKQQLTLPTRKPEPPKSKDSSYLQHLPPFPIPKDAYNFSANYSRTAQAKQLVGCSGHLTQSGNDFLAVFNTWSSVGTELYVAWPSKTKLALSVFFDFANRQVMDTYVSLYWMHKLTGVGTDITAPPKVTITRIELINTIFTDLKENPCQANADKSLKLLKVSVDQCISLVPEEELEKPISKEPIKLVED